MDCDSSHYKNEIFLGNVTLIKELKRQDFIGSDVVSVLKSGIYSFF